MKNRFDLVYRHQSTLFKGLLYAASIAIIVFFFPKGGQFKYEFQQGKPWQHQTLYAPIDFDVLKTQEERAQEMQLISAQQPPYFTQDPVVYPSIKAKVWAWLQTQDKLEDSTEVVSALDELYRGGVVKAADIPQGTGYIWLLEGQVASKKEIDELRTPQSALNWLKERWSQTLSPATSDELARSGLMLDVIQPNYLLDQDITQKALDQAIESLSTTNGFVQKGTLVIAKGEVVDAESYRMLDSLSQHFSSVIWNQNNAIFIVLGYVLLVAMVLLMMFLFLKKYRPKVYRNNTQVTFIFFNMIAMVVATSLVVQYNADYLFVVPLSILPLILKTFFDARLGLFSHVLTVLVLGFVVPNSFEYIFLQIMAGVVTILSVTALYKRANLFISVGQITLVYAIGYLSFHLIQEGTWAEIKWITLGYFALNGMITLFVQPLIYAYEKVFGLVSEVSLLELSDTNTALLKELSIKAPGTFHHSLQVANLAEAAANEIGANAMLVRVGALYHDLGKMNNPTYFTENQKSSVNPHDEISARESAQIIIEHVRDGIEIAKKNKLPDRLIDFIRTHHGTSQVYYFYKKALERDAQVDINHFTYPGPLPFSKETAILMMADAVEAASKSLKNPTYEEIDSFVERIIQTQVEGDQMINANITFKEIIAVKKVLKAKLTNIYHLRVAYPI
ncbi:MAG: HDIG domain-containing protein [Flavobacteriaceae bacterium]|nr:HDIG domain-containing protein [Flavobacteriaceae bacterium]